MAAAHVILEFPRSKPPFQFPNITTIALALTGLLYFFAYGPVKRVFAGAEMRRAFVADLDVPPELDGSGAAFTTAGLTDTVFVIQEAGISFVRADSDADFFVNGSDGGEFNRQLYRLGFRSISVNGHIRTIPAPTFTPKASPRGNISQHILAV
jgi:hypothetical protein